MTPQKNYFTTLCFMCLMGVFHIGCQPEKRSLIAPPIPELNIQFSKYTVTAEDGGTITHPNGSTISFPPNAFVTANGELATGHVEVKYREFHDAIDVFLSGIPMEYKETGETKIFQTAGMFELRAEQNGEPLSLQAGKPATVRMASYVQGDEYQFYALNETTEAWELVGQPQITANDEKKALLAKLENEKPMPFPFDPAQQFVFDYNALLDIEYGSVYRAKKLGKAESAPQKLAAYGVAHFHTRLYSQIRFEGKLYPASFMIWQLAEGAQKLPKWAKNLQYHREKLVKVADNRYGILLEDYETKRKVYTEIEPVMPLQFLLRYPPSHWKNHYDEALAQVQQEAERAAQMAEVYREFSVSSFGIFNHDYFMKDDQNVTLFASFDFGKALEVQSLEAQAIESVYMVCADNRTVINFYKENWDQLTIAPSQGARLFAILPGRELAVMPAEAFSSIDFAQLSAMPNPAYTFQLMPTGIVVESAQDIKTALGISQQQPIL